MKLLPVNQFEQYAYNVFQKPFMNTCVASQIGLGQK